MKKVSAKVYKLLANSAALYKKRFGIYIYYFRESVKKMSLYHMGFEPVMLDFIMMDNMVMRIPTEWASDFSLLILIVILNCMTAPRCLSILQRYRELYNVSLWSWKQYNYVCSLYLLTSVMCKLFHVACFDTINLWIPAMKQLQATKPSVCSVQVFSTKLIWVEPWDNCLFLCGDYNNVCNANTQYHIILNSDICFNTKKPILYTCSEYTESNTFMCESSWQQWHHTSTTRKHTKIVSIGKRRTYIA